MSDRPEFFGGEVGRSGSVVERIGGGRHGCLGEEGIANNLSLRMRGRQLVAAHGADG
jgi:hypothetical protein